MKILKNKKAVLIILLITIILIGISTKIVLGATKGTILQIGLPRTNQTAVWGHSSKTLMNGWKMPAQSVYTARCVDSYNSDTAYCIEPGVQLTDGISLTKKGESYWDNYPSLNNSISPDDVKIFIGRIMQYGYTGKNNLNWSMNNETHKNEVAHLIATQLLIWETVVGERNQDFSHIDTGDCDAILSTISSNHPLRSKILSYYNSIVTSVQNHTKIPSFFARSTGKAQTVELKYNGTNYTTTLTDSNNVLSNYTFSSTTSGISFNVSGNKLTITSQTAPTEKVTITANKTNSKRKGIITWTDGKVSKSVSNQEQDVVSWTESVSDPVKAYLKIEVKAGNLRLVKTSEDGEISGIKFTIVGENYNNTVTTANDGTFEISNLPTGTYSITEASSEKYEPQATKTVTVVGGQTTTVNFSNTLRKGNLKLVKKSEDGKVSGIRFTITGNNFSKVVTSGSDGSITLNDLIIGTYSITEESFERYEPQATKTVKVEYNKTATVEFSNVLKKGELQVLKTAEDGMVSGKRFHLYGTSLSGQYIDKYETTNSSGIATFSNILISSNQGYTLEEIDTEIKYVVPKPLNISINWNEITKATVANKLKKFNVTVTKTDLENKTAQGDGKLSGAIYGIYQNGNLIDKYTTDENGKFTTKYYICGDNWTLKEITPSEGYLLNPTSYSIGAEAKKYTIEYNKLSQNVTEQVIKGNISILKHTDNGETQIETPENRCKI